ncbi:hypothetical protein BD770DRAFT_377871 [Pilaira anomala]|nr:hypothetical protein BD770DRAFT_377871 [Pilaira anomala]
MKKSSQGVTILSSLSRSTALLKYPEFLFLPYYQEMFFKELFLLKMPGNSLMFYHREKEPF